MIGIVISVTAKGGSINDQIITCLFKFEAIGVTTLKGRVSSLYPSRHSCIHNAQKRCCYYRNHSIG